MTVNIKRYSHYAGLTKDNNNATAAYHTKTNNKFVEENKSDTNK